jgi:hypothetical protein
MHALLRCLYVRPISLLHTVTHTMRDVGDQVRPVYRCVKATAAPPNATQIYKLLRRLQLNYRSNSQLQEE